MEDARRRGGMISLELRDVEGERIKEERRRGGGGGRRGE